MRALLQLSGVKARVAVGRLIRLLGSNDALCTENLAACGVPIPKLYFTTAAF